MITLYFKHNCNTLPLLILSCDGESIAWLGLEPDKADRIVEIGQYVRLYGRKCHDSDGWRLDVSDLAAALLGLPDSETIKRWAKRRSKLGFISRSTTGSWLLSELDIILQALRRLDDDQVSI